MKKKKYEVKLNWHGEVKTYWRWATSEDQALSHACIALGKEAGHNPLSVRQHVKGKASGYEVREVKPNEKT
jgi:uncharacterized protein YabE (DUF348 family)